MSPPPISLQGDLKDLLQALHVLAAGSFLPTSVVAISGLTRLEFSLILPKDSEHPFFLLFFFPRTSFLPLHESKLLRTIQEGKLLVLRVLLASPVSAIAVSSLSLYLVSALTTSSWYLEGIYFFVWCGAHFFCDGACSDNTSVCSEGTGKRNTRMWQLRPGGPPRRLLLLVVGGNDGHRPAMSGNTTRLYLQLTWAATKDAQTETRVSEGHSKDPFVWAF